MMAVGAWHDIIPACLQKNPSRLRFNRVFEKKRWCQRSHVKFFVRVLPSSLHKKNPEAIVVLQSINLYVCNYDQASRKIRTETSWSVILLLVKCLTNVFIVTRRHGNNNAQIRYPGPHKFRYLLNLSERIQLNAKLNMIVP